MKTYAQKILEALPQAKIENEWGENCNDGALQQVDRNTYGTHFSKTTYWNYGIHSYDYFFIEVLKGAKLTLIRRRMRA